MDCDKAGDAMMRYMDKTLKPAKAVALVRHVMKCESCREYFLAFDEAAETLDSLTPAPKGFTESVMAKVRRLPAVRPAVTRADIGVRIYWGLCAVLLGLTLGLTWYQDAVAAYVATNPQLTAVVELLNAVGQVKDQLWEQFLLTGGQMQAGTVSALSGAGYTPLVFVVMLASLLIVVRRGENSKA